jgi:hypothetical protein
MGAYVPHLHCVLFCSKKVKILTNCKNCEITIAIL